MMKQIRLHLAFGLTGLCSAALAAEQPQLPSVQQSSAPILKPRDMLLAEFRRSSASYVSEFEPGAHPEESIPDFAKGLLFGASRPSDLDLQGSSAPSAKALQSQLMDFFASQAEISEARVSVACGTNYCVLQFIEPQDRSVPDHDKNAAKLWRRLTTQSWYWEEFSSNTSRFLPRDGSVWYQISILARHIRSPAGAHR